MKSSCLAGAYTRHRESWPHECCPQFLLIQIVQLIQRRQLAPYVNKRDS